MPNTTSAKKALRQNEKRRAKNLSVKRNIKKNIKQFDSFVTSGNLDEANKQLQSVFKALDKAAKTGVIKKNKSSRLKSRLSIRLNKVSTSGAESQV